MSRLSPYTVDQKLAPLFVEENIKIEQEQLFHLITLILPEWLDPLQLVDSNHDVVFGGLVYLKFPVKFNGASISTDGSIDKASINIANVSRDIMFYVEKYDGLQNCRVKIKTVYANALDELYTLLPDGSVEVAPNPGANNRAYIEDEFIIDNYSANEQSVVFQLDPIIDLEIKLPRRRYMVDSCYWDFKDRYTCKYSGPATSCNKTLASCRSHNNESNFGGFPGISGSRRIFL